MQPIEYMRRSVLHAGYKLDDIWERRSDTIYYGKVTRGHCMTVIREGIMAVTLLREHASSECDITMAIKCRQVLEDASSYLINKYFTHKIDTEIVRAKQKAHYAQRKTELRAERIACIIRCKARIIDDMAEVHAFVIYDDIFGSG